MTAAAIERDARETTDDATTAWLGSFAVSVPRSALVDALTRVQVKTTGKVFLPILQSILVEVTRDGVTLASSDLDQWVTTRVDNAAVIGTGRAALPGQRLREIVTNLPAGATVSLTVTGSARGSKAKIVAGRAKFELLGLPVDEWPVQPEFTPTLAADLDGKGFVAALQRIQAHAADQGEPVLQGALLEAAPDGLFLVCAQRISIARAELAPPAPAATESRFDAESIIPRSAFPTIIRLFGAEDTLHVSSAERQCRFEGAVSSVTFRLIEGPYSPYRRLLTLDPVVSVWATRTELMGAIKRVAIAADDAGAILFRFRETEILLTSRGSALDGGGNASDAVTATRTIHQAATAGNLLRLNAKLMLDALAAVPGEGVLIQYIAADKPVYVRDADNPASKSVAMLAGMRVDAVDAGENEEDATDA